MTARLSLSVALAAATWFAALYAPAKEPPAAKDAPPKTSQAWTLDEAMRQLQFHPDDVYLQYVALQLARNENKLDETANRVQQLAWGRRAGWRAEDRRVDLFTMFTGALAVQESLQLDTMRGRPSEPLIGPPPPAGGPPRPERRREEQPAAPTQDPAKNVVKLSDLQGPTVKSHPWDKMLAAQQIGGKKPEVSPLSLCAPEDQYFVLFRSLSKLLEAADMGDLWGAHLMSQAAKSAKTHQTSQRLKAQLAVETDLLTRPFYDMVVEEVAITGSDLYFREGSDVTVLFQVKQPEVFRLRMDGFLVAAEKSRRDAVRSTGKIQGTDYVEVSTPDRALHAFSAYPRPNLHVRSNSKAGLERVLKAIAGGGDMKRLGESTEMKYIRTLMVRGDAREDGFIYLSDPLIRRLVGPELKLTERRRMLCYNHLRMIGHAAMLYRTQYGKPAGSLEQLAAGRCAPAVFGKDQFFCPCGGTYRLSDDGTTGVCSHHGHPDQLIPCCEIPLERVTEEEAKEYKQFVERYSQYWRRYFDPIAIRLQLTPEKYRAETIILPLIDNTVYSTLAMALGGEPEPLDGLPVPKRNIFSMVVRLNKEAILKQKEGARGMLRELQRAGVATPDAAAVEEFLTKGIGNQIGLHVYDAAPMFDFNLTGFIGEMLGTFRGGGGGLDSEIVPISFLVASLNSPVYLALPVKDAQVVDKFLDQLDASLAAMARGEHGGGFWNFGYDFYQAPLVGNDPRVRCWCLALGPVKWRMFFARLGDGLYIASKPVILEDLAAMKEPGKPADAGPAAHGMIRVRPEHWNEALPQFRLGWAESGRQACLSNLGPLSAVARALEAAGDKPPKMAEVCRAADKLHAVHFFCPEGGKYELSADGKQITCSVHGTAAAPRQLAAPAAHSAMGRLMKQFRGLTTELTFLEDGLHAVVTVDRK